MAESISFQFPQLFPELIDMNVFIATIDDIDYDNDTADVTIDGVGSFSAVEIFYHCQDCDNTTGGSKAFDVGDSVYILNPKGSCSPSVTDPFTKMRIVGHTDGVPHYCGVRFEIKLTRADDTLIDDTLYNQYCSISFYATDDTLQENVEREYDAENERHIFTFLPSKVGGVLESEFYIKGVYSQYSVSFVWFPDKYQSVYETSPPASCLKEEGTYDFEFPYWKYDAEVETGDVEQIGSVHKIERTIYSSIPYKITHYLTGNANRYVYIRYQINWNLYYLQGGYRCCSSQYAISRFYIADVNPFDPADPIVVAYDEIPYFYPHDSGWGDSLVKFTVGSSQISHTETYPQPDAIDIESVEDGTPQILGTTHSIQISNDTTPHTIRAMTCGPVGYCTPCCTTGVQSATHPLYWKARHRLSFGLKDITYDFE